MALPSTNDAHADPSLDEAARKQFEAARREGRPDPLEEFLPPDDHPHYLGTLEELVHIDLEFAWKSQGRPGDDGGPTRQTPPRVEDYLARFPRLTEPPIVRRLAEQEYLVRNRYGDRPSPDEFARRFPEVLTAEDLASTQPAREPAPEAPVALPGYEVLGPLGEGGMGVVYKARQKGLNRLVALKMIRGGAWASAEELARFRTEAEAVARLQHPNIVQIYDVGEHAGQPYFSLEYVDGGSLAQKLRGQPLPGRQAAELVETLAHAVHYAHESGVVHRDLKPANILLQPIATKNTKSHEKEEQSREEVGSFPFCDFSCFSWPFVPKVTDFGLAKQVDRDAGQTRTGAVLGTPSYMAPEQAAGRSRDPDPRTDVYALGAILYELLTGRPPFRGTTMLETLEQVRSQEPVSPSRLQPNVPRDLETICSKCLRKEAGQRYGSAAALAEDLRRFRAGEPIQARPVPSWERAVKWARRRPAQTALIATAVLAVLGLSAGGLFFGLYKDQQAAALKQQLDRRRQIDDHSARAKEAEAAGHLDNALHHWDSALALLQANPGPAEDDLRRRTEDDRARVAELLRAQQRRLEEQAGRQQALERTRLFEDRRTDLLTLETDVTVADRAANAAAIRRAAPEALAQLGLTVGERPGETARGLEPYRPHLDSRQLAQLAGECYEVLLAWAEAEAASRPAEGEAAVRRALALLDAAAALGEAHRLPDSPAFHRRRARYLDLQGDRDGARAEGERAARLQADTALDHFLAALDAYGQGRLEQASRACDLALHREPDHFWAQYLRALCDLRAGKWEGAKVRLSACLSRRPGFFWALLFQATAEGELGASDPREYRAAEEDFADALRQAVDPLARSVVLTNRGALWVRRQRWDEAVQDLQEAIRLRPDAYQAYANLARAHEGREDWAAAVDALGRALEHRPEDAGLYYTRARLHLLRGDAAAAGKDFEKVIALEAGDGDSPRLAGAHVELAHLRHRAGDYPAALASCDAALRARPDYAPAHRQRAETLLALDRYAEAGRELDRYRATAPPRAEVERARALIHVRLGEYPEAVEAYTRALQIQRDAATLSYRGWAYLKLEAPRPALADFQAALQLDADHTDALCGRGYARVYLGQVPAGVEDVEQAVRHGPRTAQLLFNAACIYARAAAERQAANGQRPGVAGEVARYQDRAADLLRTALEEVPDGRRQAFWRDVVLKERDLVPLHRHDVLLRLDRLYGR
jgi:serine/threonine protein kinase/Tfp pilus assembly protein PilF